MGNNNNKSKAVSKENIVAEKAASEVSAKGIIPEENIPAENIPAGNFPAGNFPAGNIHSGHRSRIRDKFLENGISSFNDHQIIEFLLFYSCPRRDTNELAHTIINKFGSVAGVFDASVNDLTSIDGVSENAAALFKLIPQCMQIYYASHTQNICIDSTEKMKDAFLSCFIGKVYEEFRVLCFDNDLRIVSSQLICTGSPSGVEINIRKIVEAVVSSGSSIISLGHNHPTGKAMPSTDDINATRRIIDVMNALGIKVLDHIIVTPRETVSMRELGSIGFFEQ